MPSAVPPGSIDDRSDVVITNPQTDEILKYNGTNWVNGSAPGGGSGDLVLISTSTASSSSSIDFTGLDNTYSVYRVYFLNVIQATNGASLDFRLSTDNGSTFLTSNYTFMQSVWTHANPPSNFIAGSSSSDRIKLNTIKSTAAEGLCGYIDIINPTDSASKTYINAYHTSNQTAINLCVNSGTRTLAEDNDAIRFFPSAGTISSGTFKLYGIK